MSSSKKIETLLGVPPNDIELELAVLGACMLERDAYDEIASTILSPDYFYDNNNATIFGAIMELSRSGSKIDLLLVTAHLRKQNKIDDELNAYYLTKITQAVMSSAHIENHARILAEHYKARVLLATCQNTVSMILKNEMDVFDILSHHEKAVRDISDGSGEGSSIKVGEAHMNVLMEIEEQKESKSGVFGVDTGYEELNEITNGWNTTDLIILAARPSVGKTALALNFAINAADSGVGVLFFSIEMSTNQLVSRLAAIKSEVFLYYINKRKVEQWQEDKLYSNTDYFNKLNFYIDDRTKHIQRVVAKIKAHKKKHPNLKVVFIDYLQIMQATVYRGANREQEVAAISRELKAVAKDEHVAVIALSQINRVSEGRSDKKPELSHLRESGAIEQDADVVMMIWREQEPESDDQKHTIIFAKNRNGATGDIELKFNKDIQRWERHELPVPISNKSAQSFTSPVPKNPYAGMRRDPYPNDKTDLPF